MLGYLLWRAPHGHLKWIQNIESIPYTKFQYISTGDLKSNKIIVAISDGYANEENLLFYSRSIWFYKCWGIAWISTIKSTVHGRKIFPSSCRLGWPWQAVSVSAFLLAWHLTGLGIRGVFTIVFILLGIAGGANVVYRQIMDIIEPKK